MPGRAYGEDTAGVPALRTVLREGRGGTAVTGAFVPPDDLVDTGRRVVEFIGARVLTLVASFFDAVGTCVGCACVGLGFMAGRGFFGSGLLPMAGSDGSVRCREWVGCAGAWRRGNADLPIGDEGGGRRGAGDAVELLDFGGNAGNFFAGAPTFATGGCFCGAIGKWWGDLRACGCGGVGDRP